jgi:hydrogenase/urease accessory protein HupE
VKYLVAFGRFWWDFVVGDDWRAAALVLVAIGVTAAVAASDIAAWWVMPLAVVLVLGLSLRRSASS